MIEDNNVDRTSFSLRVPPNYLENFPPYRKQSTGKNRNDFYDEYRTFNISRYLPAEYNWGTSRIPYTPKPNQIISQRKAKWDALTGKPPIRITYVDLAERQAIDDFYMACQFHRDQYKDTTGKLHPLDYFKTSETRWQCPPDMLNTYVKYPLYWTKQKMPTVQPTTMERTCIFPLLPDRKLTGVYSLGSDMYYNR